jgi:predicted SAM-dependent methyltransferase
LADRPPSHSARRPGPDAADLAPVSTKRMMDVSRTAQEIARNAVRRSVILPIRRRYYTEGLGHRVFGCLPSAWRTRLGLDDDAARRSRRVEIGAGPHPQPGYIHVDVDPDAADLEVRAVAWDLPFPTAWATEILAIHSLEHIPPNRLHATLTEWHRVLRPNGLLRVHVPNSPALMNVYVTATTVAEKWRMSGALLGMYCGPDARGPDDLAVPSDHQILFDREMLEASLLDAGFADPVDLTQATMDRHNVDWRHVLDRYSLVLEARKPANVPAP